MNSNKHKATKTVVGSKMERTTQKILHMLNTERLKISENALSCFSCLSPACRSLGAGRWLQNIRVHRCLSVVPNLSVFSVFSVVKTGGAE